MLFSIFSYSQDVKLVHLAKPGTLSKQLSYNQLSEISNLTLTGEMNAKDFHLINSNMPELRSLNMKDVQIIAYSGTTGPQSLCRQYPQNELPVDAFWNKKYLENVQLPDNVVSIGNGAFAGCLSLTSIKLPPSLQLIDSAAFEGCIKLKVIEIPSSVNSISAKAFNLCSSLENVKLNEGLKSIGQLAFANCPVLTELALPKSLKNIGAAAFAHCENLREIDVYNPRPAILSNDDVSPFVGLNKLTLFVPVQSVQEYKSADVWGDLKRIKPLK